MHIAHFVSFSLMRENLKRIGRKQKNTKSQPDVVLCSVVVLLVVVVVRVVVVGRVVIVVDLVVVDGGGGAGALMVQYS